MKIDDDDKLICGHTARKYLNCSKAEFECLVKQGAIKACRDEDMRWKVSKNSVLDYVRRSKLSSSTRLVTNQEHYDKVVQIICGAKSSIKIMTANFKRFRLKPTAMQGVNYNDGTPFIEYLMDKAAHGVSVQIVCSNPSESFTEEWQEYYREMGEPDLFEYQFSDRNHSKVYIIDDKIAYVGSANVTKAGLRQLNDANYEAGILTENPELVTSIKDFFSMVWEGVD
jgi:phosphatidylserine/phosphatidylglycerophosphate/cardiolipin synthase-like enzyme